MENAIIRVFKISTLNSTLLAILFVVLVFRASGASAQDLSAADILKKVSENYSRVSSFSVVAERKVAVDTDTSGERYSPGNVDGANVVVVGSHESADIQVLLTSSSSSKAKLMLRDNKKEVDAVTDGKVVWTLLPAQHVFTELPARSLDTQRPVFMLRFGSDDISGINLIEEYETLVAGRFRNISDSGSHAKLEHSEMLKVGKEKKGLLCRNNFNATRCAKTETMDRQEGVHRVEEHG